LLSFYINIFIRSKSEYIHSRIRKKGEII